MLRHSVAETILIVEDDAAIRRYMKRALTGAGYTVLEASSGTEAKAILEADQPVDIAISDIRMPGGNGLDFAVDLEALRPGTPILYVSGLVDSVAVESILLREPRSMLSKPFTAQELLDRVGMILADPSPQPLKSPGREAAGRKPRRNVG